MSALDGDKKKTRQIRGTKSSGEYLVNKKLDSRSGSDGDPNERESVGVNRDDGSSERVTRAVKRTEAIVGGTISHLITEYRDQMALKKSEMERLETRIAELESLLQDLKADSTEENI